MIVITTPTGQIGSQVLTRLMATEEDLRVIVRDPSRLPADVRERAEVVVGSHDQPDVVGRAFAQADSVLWVVPPDPRASSVIDHYLEFTRPACEALTWHGVEQVVGVTSLGHGWPGDAGNLSAAMAMDQLIQATGVSYRALAAPFFMENLLGHLPALTADGTFTMTNAADRPLRTVATADIADTAAHLLLDGTWRGQEVVPVVGPDALAPIEMAEAMSEVLQRPVHYRQVEKADFTSRLLGFGLSPAWVRGLVDMTTAQDEGIYEAALRSPGAPASLAARRTSFREWCEQVLRPAMAA